ncbi:MAG TPA: hypothetical protein VFH74_12190 [Gaiellales bacterium]|nr:hypothetical protein [Gaiellales bacterium]
MPRVIRLVTVVDARDTESPTEMSVSVRLDAVLDDGRTVTLLDGRGWTAGLRGPGVTEASDGWSGATAEEIERMARIVVGPDEPFGGRTQADMDADHGRALADRLRTAGVEVDPTAVCSLLHEVVLSDALRDRLEPAR